MDYAIPPIADAPPEPGGFEPDRALRSAGGNEGQAAGATFIPDERQTVYAYRHPSVQTGTWASPWETARCPHGRLYSFRWTLRGTAAQRPTADDFGSSEPEYGRHGCRKCHPEED